MALIHLLPYDEKIAPSNPWDLDPVPLYHQLRTVEALRTHDLVVNTYNTGTGKTRASLLYLFDIDRAAKNVLFIAPTNALLAQHTEDIRAFVEQYGLDYKVLPANAADIRALRLAQHPEVTPTRPGELLQRLIRNYLEFEPAAVRRQPIILVVNPDIFYYALYFRYGGHDQRNVFEQFLSRFDYIVVDELHYYDSKQLANFFFAFALFEQFGYFETRGRKVCLLSATPADQVGTYLDRLLGNHRWALISPGNEPPESARFERLPTLAPLELVIEPGEIQQWAQEHRADVTGWVVRDDLDGAVISSSLWRINAAYAALRVVLAEERMGRITGPEPAEERIRATSRDLILATPTVDIGYNFEKMEKLRQNVDFLVCDALYGDELLQRIGRAGRVLGKSDIGRPSSAVALLRTEAAEALCSYDGQTLSRADFASIVKECPYLPPKHNLTGYIRSYALVESFLPIYQIGKILPQEDQAEIEALFERLKAAFAPQSRRTPGGIGAFFRKYESRERWLRATRSAMPLDQFTAMQMADWCEWLDPSKGRPDPAALVPHLDYLLGNPEQQRGLQAFVQSQVAVTRALFAFRDSFQGPAAVLSDPHHLVSSQDINVIDLFHLVSYYRISPPLSRDEFERRFGDTDLRGDFYVTIIEPREPPLTLELVYDSEDEREDFARKWCGAVVALPGVRFRARERGGDVLAGALDERIATSLADTPLTMLVIPPEDIGAAQARLRGTDLWLRRFCVRFTDGSVDDSYRVVLGSGAFHAHAELQGHFLLREKMKPEPIII